MEYLARVNPKYFAAIQLYAAQQDVRYYLNGVCIEPHPEKGVIIVATNGNCLGAIHDPDGWCKETIIVGDIPKALLAACKTSSKKWWKASQLWIGSNCAVVSAGESAEDVTIEPGSPFDPSVIYAGKITIVDGKFPDWRRVTPKKELPLDQFRGIPGFNAGYVGKMVGFRKALGLSDRYGCGISITLSEARAMVIRLPDADLADRFFALVMPMGIDAPKGLIPAALEVPALPPVEKAIPKPRYRHTAAGWVPAQAEAEVAPA